MFKLRTSLTLALLGLSLAGCKDDPLGVNSGDPLTEDELQVVFFAISEAFSTFGVAPAAAGPARATISVNESFSGNAECDGGGTIGASGSASGTVDDETFELDLDYQMRMTPNGCVVQTEMESITLDGAPYIQLELAFLLTETQIVISGSETGGIAFTSTDGRSGSCAFDVTFSASVNLDTSAVSSSTSGTVCGVSVTNLVVFNPEVVT